MNVYEENERKHFFAEWVVTTWRSGWQKKSLVRLPNVVWLYNTEPYFLYSLAKLLLLTPVFTLLLYSWLLLARTRKNLVFSRILPFCPYQQTESRWWEAGLVHCSFISSSDFSCSPGLGVRTHVQSGNTSLKPHFRASHWVSANSNWSEKSKSWSTNISGKALINFSGFGISSSFLVLQNLTPYD